MESIMEVSRNSRRDAHHWEKVVAVLVSKLGRKDYKVCA